MRLERDWRLERDRLEARRRILRRWQAVGRGGLGLGLGLLGGAALDSAREKLSLA